MYAGKTKGIRLKKQTSGHKRDVENRTGDPEQYSGGGEMSVKVRTASLSDLISSKTEGRKEKGEGRYPQGG